MSSDILARVEALQEKANELCDKGHLLRSAENYGRAAEAARALGADNLVMLHLQMRQGSMLGGHAVLAPSATTGSDPLLLAACRAEYIKLFSGVIAVLERRRLADTLLAGTCSAAEESWRASAWLCLQLSSQRGNRHDAAATAASLAALFGYEEFVRAASGVLLALLFPGRFSASECSAAQFRSFAEHVVHATELMQQPRRYGDVPLDDEIVFTNRLHDAVANAGANGLDARLVQLMAGAWQRLQRSGVLRARSIEGNTGSGIALSDVDDRAFDMAIRKSMNAPGLRHCALPGCGAKEAHPAHFKSCAACRTVVYCCREHQVEGWPAHKKACKAARKATAAEDGGAGPSGA